MEGPWMEGNEIEDELYGYVSLLIPRKARLLKNEKTTHFVAHLNINSVQNKFE